MEKEKDLYISFERSLLNLKIHIVEKAETLTDIAIKYHTAFEKLIKLNPQIANTNMIMPGMKIKIPSKTKKISNIKENDEFTNLTRNIVLSLDVPMYTIDNYQYDLSNKMSNQLSSEAETQYCPHCLQSIQVSPN